MHSALSEPFNDPPREVYSHRAAKDLKRYNKLQPWVQEANWGVIEAGAEVVIVAAIDPAKHMLCGLGAHFALLAEAEKAGFKPRTRGVIEASPTSLTVRFQGPLKSAKLELFTPQNGTETQFSRLLDWLPKYSVEGNAILYAADRVLYPAWKLPNGLPVMCAQGVLKQLMVHAIYTALDEASRDFYLCCYWDLLGAVEFVTSLGSSPPFLMGDLIWPSPDAPNESNTVNFGRALTLANILDRRDAAPGTGGRIGTQVDKMVSLRPPNLRWSAKNFEQQAERFLAWSVALSPFFQCDGGPIKKSESAGA
jgi:hypothetical protein